MIGPKYNDFRFLRNDFFLSAQYFSKFEKPEFASIF